MLRKPKRVRIPLQPFRKSTTATRHLDAPPAQQTGLFRKLKAGFYLGKLAWDRTGSGKKLNTRIWAFGAGLCSSLNQYSANPDIKELK